MPERINPIPIDALSQPIYRIALFDKKPESWASIKDTIVKLHLNAFPPIDDLEQTLKSGFTNPDSIAVLLYDGDNIIGYTTAAPILYYDRMHHRHVKTAYGDTTVIEASHRGKKNLKLLSEALEGELRRQGYEQMETSVVKENGFAKRVKDYYEARGRLIRELESARNDRMKLLVRI